MKLLLPILAGLLLGLASGALVRASRAVPDAGPSAGQAPHTAAHPDHGDGARLRSMPKPPLAPQHDMAGMTQAPPTADTADVDPHAGHDMSGARTAPIAENDAAVVTPVGALEVDLANATCPVMGGDAREDVFVRWRGVRVRFCCAGCDDDFLADPEALLAEAGIDANLALEVAARLVDADAEERAAVCEQYGHRVHIVPIEEN